MDNNILLKPRKFVAPEFIFGVGSRSMVASYCKNLAAKKVLLVTDKNLLKTLWLKEVIENLEKNDLHYVIFSDISPNPRDYEVMEGAEIYRQEKCNIILSVGGGSVLDCAKGIGIVSSNHQDIKKFEGIDKIEHPIPPLICIPTTSGSSADVSQFAIINNTVEKYKFAIISKAVVPDIALIDPMVLTTMDSFLTTCTGLDALSHAFEAYVSYARSAFTDLYALEAIKLIHTNLPKCLEQPDDLTTRSKVMLASLYAGLAFSNASLGCTHSLSHSLGGYLDLAHGECNAILLPHVVDYNFKSATEAYTNICSAINIHTKGLSKNNIKKALIDYLFEFRKKTGIENTLSDRGVSSDIIPILSSKAINDPCNATNPRNPNKRDFEIIYSEAM